MSKLSTLWKKISVSLARQKGNESKAKRYNTEKIVVDDNDGEEAPQVALRLPSSIILVSSESTGNEEKPASPPRRVEKRGGPLPLQKRYVCIEASLDIPV